jgi:DME family drug/metabolite transporter
MSLYSEAVAYLATVPMFLGYVLFGRGLAAVPASTATTLSLLEPAVAAVIAVLVLPERLPALGWLGTGIVLVNLVVLTRARAGGDRHDQEIVDEPGARGRRPVDRSQGGFERPAGAARR